jgi:MFS family permease
MISQAFFYNGIFFTYPLVLTSFYSVAPERLGLYLLPFAFGNFMGPLLMGHLFDSVGRRPMIAITYSLSGLLLVASGYLFALNMLTPVTQTLAWMVIFFIASSAASSAYLTVSEIFPVETRAIAISLFYSVGTGVGGVAAPYIFGVLVQSGLRLNIFYGYLVCGVLMAGSAFVELAIGVDAERKSLEDIALPLSAAFKTERIMSQKELPSRKESHI